MAPNGCSCNMDRLARWWSRTFFKAEGKGRKLAFTGCCDEHDLFYEQGGSRKDRCFADQILRRCIAANLKRRKRNGWVRLHVPWVFWAAVRLGGWYYWTKP